MNRWQKIAWFKIILITISLVMGIIAVLLVTEPWKLQVIGWYGLVMVFALTGMSNSFFEEKYHKKTRTIFDERDELIYKKACILAHSASWMFLSSVCLMPWFVIGTKGVISINWLPPIAFSGAIIRDITFSIAILVQYGRNR